MTTDTRQDPWTIGRLLTWTTDYLKGRGAESPRLDAEVLLAHARGSKRIDLYTAFDEVPRDDVRTAFRELVRRRSEGAPVAYLVGRREFYSLSFKVTPDVLIPRPETELVLVAALDFFKGSSGEPRIADVGTGSGVLAVCAAKHLPRATVAATDISPKALAVARENADSHGVSERIEFVETDLLATLPVEPVFDAILSNPPYVATAELSRLAPDVQRHEPRVALVAGDRGTETIERLIPQAAERLRPGGGLFLEVSPMVEPTVRQLLANDGHWDVGKTLKDLAGLPRVVTACRRT